ncbi:MlaD family protein [Shewanella sp.]|uniref:PqiB family protein n=2 Tax=Shewanella sp. TaxID=50422 RepID=UPI003F2A7B24
MTEIESPKVVKKKLFSPIWLLPIVALALGTWLGVKSIKESGVEIQIHFPSASGIEVGKTLVKYQGLTVGKVKDIGIDDDLTGVNVKVMMDYRAKPFLNHETLFWLVTPKATITGVEGLDALFSGNYIAIQPGKGNPKTLFEAERQPPPMQVGTEGVMVELTSDKLGSLDVGSPIFFRQIPVGSIASYRLDGNAKVIISAFIQDQYAHLVKKTSHFWNVSGVKIDASLAGVKVNSESLASILAGGVSFSSDTNAATAENGDSFALFESETSALGGVEVTLTMDEGHGVENGTRIVYRGITIGNILGKELTANGVKAQAKLAPEYAKLLTRDGHFWLEGADISLSGIKHPERLLSGSVINFLPGIDIGSALPASFALHHQAPDVLLSQKRFLTLTSSENMGITPGAQVRYKQLPIGNVLTVKLNQDFSAVEYRVEILPEFANLVRSGSYFVQEAAVTVDASLDGLSVTSRDFATLTKGAVSLIQGADPKPLPANTSLPVFNSKDSAEAFFKQQNRLMVTLINQDGADVSQGSPIYYQKMQIGVVDAVKWQNDTNDFAITLAIDNQFKALLRKPKVFWRNNAVDINASLAGINVAVAPLQGALKGSISLGLLDKSPSANAAAPILYASKSLALAQAVSIRLTLDASAKLTEKAAIRYQGHQVGEVSQVKLNADLTTLTASAYLYGEYAEHFSRSDSEYHLIDAQISLAGIKAPETLISGAYIGVLPGKKSQKAYQFTAKLGAQTTAMLPAGALKFTLEDSSLGAIKVGTAIFFRGIKIGQVDGYRLSSQGNSVLMQAHIEPQYRDLVNQSSQFWNASGIKVDAGIFSGVQIETGTLETIIAGGIYVATKESTQASNRLPSGAVIKLQHQVDKEWLSWAPANRLAQP